MSRCLRLDGVLACDVLSRLSPPTSKRVGYHITPLLRDSRLTLGRRTPEVKECWTLSTTALVRDRSCRLCRSRHGYSARRGRTLISPWNIDDDYPRPTHSPLSCRLPGQHCQLDHGCPPKVDVIRHVVGSHASSPPRRSGTTTDTGPCGNREGLRSSPIED